MREVGRDELLNLNERLCAEYSETGDPSILAEIAETERRLFWHYPPDEGDDPMDGCYE